MESKNSMEQNSNINTFPSMFHPDGVVKSDDLVSFVVLDLFVPFTDKTLQGGCQVNFFADIYFIIYFLF